MSPPAGPLECRLQTSRSWLNKHLALIQQWTELRPERCERGVSLDLLRSDPNLSLSWGKCRKCGSNWSSTHRLSLAILDDIQGVSGFDIILTPPLTLDRVVQSWCPLNGWTSTLAGLFWGIMKLGTWSDDCRTGGEGQNLVSETPNFWGSTV